MYCSTPVTGENAEFEKEIVIRIGGRVFRVNRNHQKYYRWCGNIILFIATSYMSLFSLFGESCEKVSHDGSSSIRALAVLISLLPVEIIKVMKHYENETKTLYALMDIIFTFALTFLLFFVFPSLDSPRCVFFQLGFIALCLLMRFIGSEFFENAENGLCSLPSLLLVIIIVIGMAYFVPILYLSETMRIIIGVLMVIMCSSTYEAWMIPHHADFENSAINKKFCKGKHVYLVGTLIRSLGIVGYFLFNFFGLFSSPWNSYDISLIVLTILASAVRCIRTWYENESVHSKVYLARKLTNTFEDCALFLEANGCVNKTGDALVQFLHVVLQNPCILSNFANALKEYSISMDKREWFITNVLVE